ncbi:hypothetical protein BB8028_0004g05390 [Beauveria bassiana]|uniref:Uncharacterized protein n=2 Tax=Beauveria bassiana TaxID=176275 RepID=A0A0A2VTU5_BEABA|nr:hypothetical protein BBAD15_g5096 [Beauveria bassiana D1-5]PQK13608.1 hypothetical protein BB8028_0004g05390 [Beauveria bassiana]
MKFGLVLQAAVLKLGAVSAAASANCTADAADAAKVKLIAPGSKSCPESLPDCRTADQAAPFIFRSMSQYNLSSDNEIAAVIALMAFESGDFHYKHNAFPPPGNPGQGTANMQSPAFNLLYAKSLDGVKEKVADVETVEGLEPKKLDEILALVTPDEYNFGSGPWFLVTQCPATVRDELKEDIDCGFESYMACVGVKVTDDRKAYLTRAKEAFGLC